MAVVTPMCNLTTFFDALFGPYDGPISLDTGTGVQETDYRTVITDNEGDLAFQASLPDRTATFVYRFIRDVDAGFWRSAALEPSAVLWHPDRKMLAFWALEVPVALAVLQPIIDALQCDMDANLPTPGTDGWACIQAKPDVFYTVDSLKEVLAALGGGPRDCTCTVSEVRPEHTPSVEVLSEGGMGDASPLRLPIMLPNVPALIRPNLLSEAPHEVALALALMGFRVFPLWGIGPDGRCTCGGSPRNGQECSPGKHPKVPFTRAATSDFDTLQGMMIHSHSWTGDRRNNWAVATGLGSNLLIIDLDGDLGFDSWAAFQEQFGKPPNTVRSKSGRDGPGEHIWFMLDPGRPEPPNSASKRMGLGIDVRGQHGYAVTPGSLHRSGNRYRFLPGFSPTDVELAMLPDAYYEHLTSGVPRASPTSSRKQAAVLRPRTAEYDGPLGLGDGQGGFDTPIYRWACRYFQEEGPDADVLPLVAALRAAIGKAPKDENRDVTRYLSDEYLSRRTNQAREFIRSKST